MINFKTFYPLWLLCRISTFRIQRKEIQIPDEPNKITNVRSQSWCLSHLTLQSESSGQNTYAQRHTVLEIREHFWASRRLSNSSDSEVLMTPAWGPMFHLWDPHERPNAVLHARQRGRDRDRWIFVVHWSVNVTCLGGFSYERP